MTPDSENRGDPIRDVLASVEGLRVQLVTVAPEQRIPWHRHTDVSDTIVAILGPVIVEMRDGSPARRLEPGDRLTIPAGTAHTVHGLDGAACRFVNLHAGGSYDFVAL